MKYGNIVLVGKPNVGKSTLINTFLQKQVVIYSPKPQTTRNWIEINYQAPGWWINFFDTPGLTVAKHKLDEFLNAQVLQTLPKAHLILLLLDLSDFHTASDQLVITTLQKNNTNNTPVLVLFNKKDLLAPNEINQLTTNFLDHYGFSHHLVIQGNSHEVKEQLLTQFSSFLKEIPDDSIQNLTSKEVSEKFFVKELIRQIIFHQMRQEIPYGTAVEIVEFSYDGAKNLLKIIYNIIVEKASWKKIIIGAQGKNIKRISVSLQNELQKIYDCKIFTSSFVKVKPKWRNNQTAIKELLKME